MSLTFGAKLGPYEILSPLGAGGMGEVYRARDTELGRDVALKVLPTALASDPERMARFQREARVLASLNHPNIASIYGLEESAGVRALVMELVEGPTLAERLGTGTVGVGLVPAPGRPQVSPLPIDESLAIAKQTAEALEYAHERGIIHRDLKPANIGITPEGKVKVLDFGLAKALDPETAPGVEAMHESPLQDSPTLTADATQAGIILGTAAYMSPEQARGKTVDRRADIWSFGCVLYEMLTGKPTFEGETVSDTLASILKTEPNWSALPADTPPRTRELISRCLTKDPKQRLRDIGDARIAIEETISGDAGADPHVPPPQGASVSGRTPLHPLRRALPWALAVLVATTAFTIGRQLVPPMPPPVYQQLTFRRGPVSAARFAPDGKTVVYAAAWDGQPVELYTALLNSPEWRSLDMPGANLLAVSSTGELAVCLRGTILDHDFYRGTLARVPLGGGAPREVLENVEWADWSPDGSNLAVVHLVGGSRQLEYPVGKVLYKTSGWISYPHISPQGDKIAFFDHPVWSDDRGSLAVIDLQGKMTVPSAGWESEEGLAWSPSGKEVWFTAAKEGPKRDLYAVSLQGKLRPVARVPGDMTLWDIFSDGRVLLTRDNERAGIMGLAPGASKERDLSWLNWSYPFDFSWDGNTLLFSEEGSGTGQFYATCIRKTDGASAPVRLGEGAAQSLSPDGKWALSEIPSSPEQLVMLPTGAGSVVVLPPGPINHYGVPRAQWFPDGKRILVVGRAGGHGYRCYVQDVNGGDPKPVTPEGTVGWLLSPDGNEVLVSDSQDKFWLYRVAGGEPHPVPGLDPHDYPIQWSADGRSILAASYGGFSGQVYRFELASGKRQLWKELAPADHTGLIQVGGIVVTPNANAYAYYYETTLSDIYLAQGLK